MAADERKWVWQVCIDGWFLAHNDGDVWFVTAVIGDAAAAPVMPLPLYQDTTEARLTHSREPRRTTREKLHGRRRHWPPTRVHARRPGDSRSAKHTVLSV